MCFRLKCFLPPVGRYLSAITDRGVPRGVTLFMHFQLLIGGGGEARLGLGHDQCEGNFSKPVATFLVNFCKGVKIFIFSSEII